MRDVLYTVVRNTKITREDTAMSKKGFILTRALGECEGTVVGEGGGCGRVDKCGGGGIEATDWAEFGLSKKPKNDVRAFNQSYAIHANLMSI